MEEAFADQRREEEKHKIEEEKRRERERMEEMKRQEQYRILEVCFVQQKCSCFTPKIKLGRKIMIIDNNHSKSSAFANQFRLPLFIFCVKEINNSIFFPLTTIVLNMICS